MERIFYQKYSDKIHAEGSELRRVSRDGGTEITERHIHLCRETKYTRKSATPSPPAESNDRRRPELSPIPLSPPRA